MDNKNLNQEELIRKLEEAESKMSPQEKLDFLRKLNEFIELVNQDFSDLKKMTEEEENLKNIREKIQNKED